MDKESLVQLQRELARDEKLVPTDFWERISRAGSWAVYLVSCADQETFLFISPSFKDVTSYQSAQFERGGLPFWFARIHPQDLPRVSQQITQAHQQLFGPDFNPNLPNRLVLEYRLQRTDASWIWIEETKHIVAFTPKGKPDKILVCLRDISQQKQAQQQILEEQATTHPLLQIAMQHQAGSHERNTLSTNLQLTKRERQVLALLATGLPTKLIAHQLLISCNTVETHRRHLLEKFGVRNSAELIRQASLRNLL